MSCRRFYKVRSFFNIPKEYFLVCFTFMLSFRLTLLSQRAWLVFQLAVYQSMHVDSRIVGLFATE